MACSIPRSPTTSPKSRKTLLGAVDSAEIDAILHELEAHALSRLGEDGFSRDQIELEHAAALHYQGQSFELEVPIPVGAMDRAALAALEEAYDVEHELARSAVNLSVSLFFRTPARLS